MTSPFEKYLGTELAPELLAIIPPGVKLSPGSTVDPKNLGKVPGTYNFGTGTWSGRRDWVEGLATETMIKEWRLYPDPNIGIRAKYFPGIDFDIDLDWLIRDLLPVAEKHLGPSPVRGRDGSPRVMLIYSLAPGAEPIRTFCLKFTLPETGSTEHALEILGNGRSFVLEGRHLKGGHYEWKHGVGPIEYGPENLSLVTAKELGAFVIAVKDKLAAIGATILSGKSGGVGSSGNNAHRRKIGDPALLAMNLDTLQTAIGLIPCEEIYDRGEWLQLVIAIKGACGGSEEFYQTVVLPWCLRYDKNTTDYVRKTWESFDEANLGAEHIYRIARKYDSTFADDIEDYFKHFDEAPDQDGGQSSDPSDQSEQPERRNGPVPKLMPADFDPRKLPQRPYVLGYRFLAGAVTLGVAPPGTGKSNFSLLTALSIATGQSLTDEPVHRTGAVWIHNNEDDLDELQRRIGG
jgi:AAA domain/Primase C terminal 2 (PriCT-2)